MQTKPHKGNPWNTIVTLRTWRSKLTARQVYKIIAAEATLHRQSTNIWPNFDQILMIFEAALDSKKCFCTNNCLCSYFGFSASQRHNRVPWIALLSFLCWCEVASAAIILYTYLAVSLDLQVLNVTIVFHGLPFWACFCISYLQIRPLPRRSGRSPFESAAA